MKPRCFKGLAQGSPGLALRPPDLHHIMPFLPKIISPFHLCPKKARGEKIDPPLTSCICSPQLCFRCLLSYLTQIMIACFIWWVYFGLYFKPMKSLVMTQEDRLIPSLGGPKIAEFFILSLRIKGVI